MILPLVMTVMISATRHTTVTMRETVASVAGSSTKDVGRRHDPADDPGRSGLSGGAVQTAHQAVDKNHKHEQQPFRQLVDSIAQLFQSFHI